MRHLLVTNDFPPKVGGIQSYLWELWRRLPADEIAVLTSPYRNSQSFDRQQGFRIERIREPALLPHPLMAARIGSLAKDFGAEAVILDPATPLGLLGPGLGLPYGVILHGAEVTIPARIPFSAALLRRTLANARLWISGGGYAHSEALRVLKGAPPPANVNLPPGVDISRFAPLEPARRVQVRARWGIGPDQQLVLGVSRLVPRKGLDRVIQASSILKSAHPDARFLIAGSGRDQARLQKLIDRERAPTRLLGRVDDSDLADLYASADVFALPCRSRWGGLEQEGFGIIFLEAAAAGLATVAGRSGGSAEAVIDGVTGTVVDVPQDPRAVAAAIGNYLDHPELAQEHGRAARRRARSDFSYDKLAERLQTSLDLLRRSPID